jgi:hypothetical protein
MRWLVAMSTLCLLILSPGALTAQERPNLSVSAPQDGATLTTDSVTVTFQTSGIQLVPSPVPLSEAGKRPEANQPGEGHLHFMLDLSPVVVWEQGDPYTFTGIPAGDHQLVVELVNNDHSSLSPPVVQTVRFQVSPRGGYQASSALPRAGAPAPATGGALFVLAAGAVMLGGFILRRRYE